jgi:dihydroflavonol-4-reductase
MKLLVTGAGGFLGEHIVRAAIEAGHAVTVLVRPTAQQLFPSGVTCLEGDLKDIETARRALAGVEGVIFAAGRNWQPRLPIAEYQRQNVTPVATFFAGLAEVAPTIRVVFTSSLSARGGSLEPVVFTEESDRSRVCTDRLSPYDLAKIECERLALAARDAGRDVVILNPGYMLGPGASAESGITTTFLVQWFCQRRLPAYVRGGGASYCDVRDVAQAHVAALARTAAGQYIVGGENLDSTQIHQALTAQTGLPCPPRVSARLAYAFQAVVDGLSAATFGLWRSEVHRYFVRALPLYYWGDSSRAERDLGYHSRPIAESIRDTIADFVWRGALSEEFSYVTEMTEETRPSLLLLRQLADQHLHSAYLLPRLTRILAAARYNQDLNAALTEVLAASKYEPDRGRYAVPAGCAVAQSKLRDLLDYVYYSSDEFQRRVS